VDPDEALKKLRETLVRFRKWQEEHPSAIRHVGGNMGLDLAEDIAMYADALDQWISNGGFLPEDWRKACDP
jgi:hypothetical protein